MAHLYCSLKDNSLLSRIKAAGSVGASLDCLISLNLPGGSAVAFAIGFGFGVTSGVGLFGSGFRTFGVGLLGSGFRSTRGGVL